MKYKRILSSLIIIAVICSLSVGYSAFVKEFYITDLSAVVRAKSDIRITSLEIFESKSIVNISSDFNKDSIISNIEFESEDSYVIYKFTITNFGNVEMGILKFDNLDDELNYELLDYDYGEKICTVDGCTLGINKEIKFKVSPKTFTEKKTYSIKPVIVFRNFKTITYNNIFGLTSEEIISGGQFVKELPVGVNQISISYSNGIITNYTYSNNILDIEEVTDNIVINNISE